MLKYDALHVLVGSPFDVYVFFFFCVCVFLCVCVCVFCCLFVCLLLLFFFFFFVFFFVFFFFCCFFFFFFFTLRVIKGNKATKLCQMTELPSGVKKCSNLNTEMDSRDKRQIYLEKHLHFFQ